MSTDDYQMKMREAAAREMIRRQVLETYPSLACPDDLPEERFRIERFKSCCAMPFAERIAQLEAERAELVDAWRSWLSAQDTIEGAQFTDNYTDAARARERQSRITFEVRQILAKHKEQA